MADIVDKPAPNVKTDARPHPAGKQGAMISLQEVADRGWKARMSPRLRAWVVQQLDKCGVSRGTRRQKMACVLDAFRAKVPYISDPLLGEFMETPEQTLCLDEGGLCILGTDCDGATIVLTACAMCIGIPAMVIGCSYKHPVDTPTHVFGGFQDEDGDWVKMDGTTRHPIGHTAPHAREFWVEPGKQQKESGEGDFVGMSGADVGVGAPPDALDFMFPGLR